MPKLSPWDRIDIVTAIWRKKSTLRRLSIENGFAASTLRASLERQHPRAHTVIANFIGVSRHTIWPHWYDAQDRRLQPKASRAIRLSRAA